MSAYFKRLDSFCRRKNFHKTKNYTGAIFTQVKSKIITIYFFHNFTRADYCNEVIFQALRLRDPVRFLQLSSSSDEDDDDSDEDSDSSPRPTIKPIRVTNKKHKKVEDPPPRPTTANASTQSEQSSDESVGQHSHGSGTNLVVVDATVENLNLDMNTTTTASTMAPSSHRKIVVNKSTTTRPVQHQSAKLAKQQSGSDTR